MDVDLERIRVAGMAVPVVTLDGNKAKRVEWLFLRSLCAVLFPGSHDTANATFAL